MNNLKPKSNKQLIEEIKDYEPCNLEDYECLDEHVPSDWVLLDEPTDIDEFEMKNIDRRRRNPVMSNQ